MTIEQIRAAIQSQRHLCEKATKGPWKWGHEPLNSPATDILRGDGSPGFILGLHPITHTGAWGKLETANRAMIAASRTQWPQALDALDEAVKALDNTSIALLKQKDNTTGFMVPLAYETWRAIQDALAQIAAIMGASDA